MRALLPAFVGALGMLAGFNGASAAGGLVVFGIGTGTAYQANGDVCTEAPFEVTAHFLPDNKGIAQFSWVKADQTGGTCSDFIVDNGAAISLGDLSYDVAHLPPVSWEFACVGSEAEGLNCSDGFIIIGPYRGPASAVSLEKHSATETFFGVFVAF